MSVLQAVLLGAVQGLTEFIPISSSGHLVLVPASLGWESPALAFDVLLHVASLIALLVYFWGDLVSLVKGTLQGDAGSRRMAGLLAIGTVPAAIAGVVLGDYFEESFKDAKATAWQLGITAVILVAGEQMLRWHTKRSEAAERELRSIDDLRWPDALWVGIAQAISIYPGISRSGATISTGLALRVSRDDSARFVFLLAIPALFGAALVKLPDLAASSLGTGSAIGGFVSSLVFSYAAIAGLIRYLRTNTLYPFAVYCVVAGAIFYLIV
ncbi:MAG TPA: undecaprenyl-diphosphate phosphatase [Actinomycetota bacterium]|nr:undecaprenyl-diphosphate phosphatase [Actinomycetota bacterium]